MKTVLMHIGDRCPGEGYPLKLYSDETGLGWLGEPIAEATISDDLGAARLADWTASGRDGVVDAFRDRMLGEDRDGAVERIGQHLYDLLAQGKVAERWAELAAAPARFLLRVDDRDLQRVPWELLRRGPDYVFTNATRPWARVLAAADLDPVATPEPWQTMCPLRVLILVGSREDDQQLLAEDEIRGVVGAIAQSGLPIEWHVERRPSRGRLEEVLTWSQPHVLHFIGHSSMESDDDCEDALVIEARDGPWEYTTGLISADLQDARPRLVVLNACRLAAAGASKRAADGVWTAAGVYLRERVPAVVAMQGDISGEDACTFACGLYDALFVKRLCIDEAVTRARLRMDAAGLRRRDFGFPCLTLTSHPAAALPLPIVQLRPTLRTFIEKTYRVQPFVDRCEQRHRLWQVIGGACGQRADPSAHLVAVVGQEESGKSWLVRSCLYAQALIGHNVAYVDLAAADEGLLAPLGVLRSIRAALERCPSYGRANKQAFADLDLSDDALTKVLSDDPMSQIVDEFRERLARAARASNGLLLALDHLRGASEQFCATVGERLIRPVADGEMADVRMLVALRKSGPEATRFPFEYLQHTIEVGLLPADEYLSLALAVLYFLRWGPDAAAFASGSGFVEVADHPWRAAELGELEMYARIRMNRAGR